MGGKEDGEERSQGLASGHREVLLVLAACGRALRVPRGRNTPVWRAQAREDEAHPGPCLYALSSLSLALPLWPSPPRTP
jgi:hypothetical protein